MSFKHCAACNSPRTGDVCRKCGGPLRDPHPDWEWPSLPDIDAIRALAREVGYAIGVHGTLERDLDLIAAPWSEDAVSAPELAEHIARGINGSVLAPEEKPLGRWSCNIQIDGWFKLIDLSVAPRGGDTLSLAISAAERGLQRWLDKMSERNAPAESSPSGAQRSELSRSAQDEPLPAETPSSGGEG